MKNIYDFLTKYSVHAVFTALTGITLATNAAGIVKVAGNINSFKQKVPEIKTVQEALKEDSNLSELSPSPKVTQATVRVDKESKPSISVTPATTPSLTINGGIHSSIKPSVSVRGDDEEKSDDHSKKKDVNSDNSNNKESNHTKLELDNDTEVSRPDGQLNLNTGVQIQTN